MSRGPRRFADRLLRTPPLSPASRDTRLVRRTFLSALAAVYLVAFVSLWVQVEGLVGPEGILPAREYLERVEKNLGPERFWRVPTVSWIVGAESPSLHALCAAGCAAALALFFGFVPTVAAVLLWVLYLSLFTLSRTFLAFQWDILLLETGFLAVFWTPLRAVSPWSAAWAERPSPVVGWLLRLLLFKLMFLSGAVKLASGDPTWRNGTALAYHYETTCLPTWTGWYMHQAPLWFHRLSVAFVFFVELVVPFFALGPRALRLFAAATFTVFMALIAGTGNYGFFNLLTVVLCLPLLDDGHLGPLVRRLPLPELRRPPGAKSIVSQVPFAVLAVFLLVLNVVPFAHGLRFRPLWPGPLLGLYRATEPFHLANPYGLFARMTTSRPEIVLEGSNDAKTWQEYEFRWKPGDPRRAPAFVQPHMPRLDWRMWFAALGNLRTDPWFLSFCLRVLQGSRPVLGLLAENPFPDRPPRYLRATLYDYRFTTWDERRRTGAWWHRKRLRAYTPVLALDPGDPNRLLAVRTRP